MSRYVILIAYEPWDWGEASEEVRADFFARHAAFSAFVSEHGQEVASAALDHVETARTLKHGAGGEVVITEGPFAETAEMVGGYYEVEMPSMDLVLEAAALLPPSYTLEIRPVIAIN